VRQKIYFAPSGGTRCGGFEAGETGECSALKASVLKEFKGICATPTLAPTKPIS
jgi:hypothetical protein